jgi:hypothetical protein
MSFTAPASLCDHISSLVPLSHHNNKHDARLSGPPMPPNTSAHSTGIYPSRDSSRVRAQSTHSATAGLHDSIRMGTAPLALTALHPSPLGYALPFVDRQTQSQRSKTSYALPSQQGHQVNLSGESGHMPELDMAALTDEWTARAAPESNQLSHLCLRQRYYTSLRYWNR